jgi:hypothetical protein
MLRHLEAFLTVFNSTFVYSNIKVTPQMLTMLGILEEYLVASCHATFKLFAIKSVVYTLNLILCLISQILR